MLDGLAEYCTKALGEHDCPSVSIAVARRGEVVLERAYGWADIEDRRAATTATAYALASISKAVTATAVCAAADDGLFGLDDPVPGPDGEPAPTVRQLLQHRAGVGAYYDFHYADTPRPIDSDRYQVRFREPGSGFEYANLGYHRLGRLLERAGGRSLADCLREWVFEPLGMADTHLADRYPGSAPIARRYTPDGRAYPPVASSGTPAASSVWTTAADLARFGHLAPSLLRPETAAAAVAGLPITEHVGYGLGWIVSTGPGPQIRSHGGGMGGVAAMLIAAPEQELSVAVLTNSTNKAARDAIVEHVMTELVPGYRTEQITPFAADPARPLTLPAGSRWAGKVATADGELPIGIEVLTENQISFAIGGEAVTAPAGAHAEIGLRAVAELQLPTADARVNSPLLALELNEVDGRLVGRATACKAGDGTGWLGNFLPHRCELDRV